MSSQEIIIIISASVIGIIYLLIIRSFDIYEKEPFIKLLLVAIFGGILSVITSLFFYRFFDVERDFIDAIILIGPIEEISKLIALVIIYRFIKSDFNEIVDGLVYIAAIALGFSIIENIFYAFRASDPFGVLFQRSIFSVLGHISFSGFLGLAYFIHVRIKRNLLGIVLSILLASLAHGLYDAVLFERGFNIFFRPLFIGIIIFQFILIKIVLGFSTFRKELSIDLFESYDRTVFLKCSKCKSSIKDKGIRFWKINGVICNSCNSLVLQGDNVASLFKYFRPALRIQKYFKDLAENKKIQYLDNDERVSYNWQRTILSSSLPDLSDWLKSENEIDRKKLLKIPIIGPLIWYLGIRMISNE